MLKTKQWSLSSPAIRAFIQVNFEISHLSLSNMITPNHTNVKYAPMPGGHQYILLLMKYKSKPLATLINIEHQIFYQIEVAAQSTFFDGSIFHGWLYWQKPQSQSYYTHVFQIGHISHLKGSPYNPAYTIEHVDKIKTLFSVDVLKPHFRANWYDACLLSAKSGQIICMGSDHQLSFKPIVFTNTPFPSHISIIWDQKHHICGVPTKNNYLHVNMVGSPLKKGQSENTVYKDWFIQLMYQNTNILAGYKDRPVALIPCDKVAGVITRNMATSITTKLLIWLQLDNLSKTWLATVVSVDGGFF